jgi:Protein of unknown function (DUF2550)
VGGTLAFDGAGVLVVVVTGVLLAGIGIAGRRALLERGGGTVECGLRQPAADGSWPAWRLGVARYRRGELRWHQIFGLRLRPDETFARSGLTVLSRRLPAPGEAASLGSDAVIVRCTARGAPGPAGAAEQEQAAAGAGQVELAMGEAATTGFLAWLEAAPQDPFRRRLPAAGHRSAA